MLFDKNGQNKNAQAAMMQILKGRIAVVWPKECAEESLIFPQPMG
jgi:hypothetical protein